MEMNPEIVRALLKTIEEWSDVSGTLEFSRSALPGYRLLEEYSLDEVLYHLKKCSEAGFLVNYHPFVDSATVDDLHYSGHQFLANIHDDNIWSGVKGISAKVGSKSLDALIQIASNVVTELIKAQFGLA